MSEEFAGRHERVLAKRLIQAGETREPGETVLLRQDQIDRLEPEGYFAPAAGSGGARRGGAK
ncbi:MAG: hypothetical protein OXC28_07125 [Defluviicoccus sp.]|nr:hypothetical protein [Defluviicoccus sp.]